MNTKATNGEYKGNPTLSINKVDEQGNKVEGSYPVISFGLKKAEAIVKHIDDIKAFVEDNKNDN